jgi:hypothetical protein
VGIKLGRPNGIVDAFISFQSTDESFAKKLAGSIKAYPLDERKLEVFFSPWNIKPGDNVIEKIDEGLSKARFFLLILSPEALKADWPTAERAAAIYSDPSGRLGRVIPVLRRSCSIPPLLRFRNYADFRDESRYDAELTRLLCTLTGQPLPKEISPLALYRETLQRKDVDSESPIVHLSESWRADAVIEEVRCNLFFAESVPKKIWSAPYLLTVPPIACFQQKVSVPPHITRERRLFTFVDLSKENNPFKGAIEDFDIRSIDTKEWVGDEDHARWLVNLLNWGIIKHCQKMGLKPYKVGRRWRSSKRFYYDNDVVLKKVRWPVSDRLSPKDLIIEYKGFFAHRAVELKFDLMGSLVFLKINTGWVFTFDGYRTIEGQKAKILSTRFLSSQKNTQNFNEIRFWAWLLSKDGKKIEMDFGEINVDINAKPLSATVPAGVFGDYRDFSQLDRGPPKIFEEAAKEDAVK